MNSIASNRIFFALACWLAVGLLIALLGIGVTVKDWLADRKRKRLPFKLYMPFAAGRLSLPDGKHRSDAFGIKIPAADPIPKPGEKIHIALQSPGGLKNHVFTVAMCETLSQVMPASQSDESQNVHRAEEVYVLIRESLSDETIIAVNRLNNPMDELEPVLSMKAVKARIEASKKKPRKKRK
jgi:hypothetical protein